jgi:hypothetical protein
MYTCIKGFTITQTDLKMYTCIKEFTITQAWKCMLVSKGSLLLRPEDGRIEAETISVYFMKLNI